MIIDYLVLSRNDTDTAMDAEDTLTLVDDVLLHMLGFVASIDVLSWRLTCRHFRTLASSSAWHKACRYLTDFKRVCREGDVAAIDYYMDKYGDIMPWTRDTLRSAGKTGDGLLVDRIMECHARLYYQDKSEDIGSLLKGYIQSESLDVCERTRRIQASAPQLINLRFFLACAKRGRLNVLRLVATSGSQHRYLIHQGKVMRALPTIIARGHHDTAEFIIDGILCCLRPNGTKDKRIGPVFWLPIFHALLTNGGERLALDLAKRSHDEGRYLLQAAAEVGDADVFEACLNDMAADDVSSALDHYTLISVIKGGSIKIFDRVLDLSATIHVGHRSTHALWPFFKVESVIHMSAKLGYSPPLHEAVRIMCGTCPMDNFATFVPPTLDQIILFHDTAKAERWCTGASFRASLLREAGRSDVAEWLLRNYHFTHQELLDALVSATSADNVDVVKVILDRGEFDAPPCRILCDVFSPCLPSPPMIDVLMDFHESSCPSKASHAPCPLLNVSIVWHTFSVVRLIKANDNDSIERLLRRVQEFISPDDMARLRKRISLCGRLFKDDLFLLPISENVLLGNAKYHLSRDIKWMVGLLKLDDLSNGVLDAVIDDALDCKGVEILLILTRKKGKDALRAAAARSAKLGRLDWLRQLHEERGFRMNKAEIMEAALSEGHLDIACWLCDRGCPVPYHSLHADDLLMPPISKRWIGRFISCRAPDLLLFVPRSTPQGEDYPGAMIVSPPARSCPGDSRFSN